MEKQIVIVNVPLLNVRASGKKEADNVIKEVSFGEELEVIKVNKKWTETTEGFVMTEFVKEKENGNGK